MNEMHKWFNWYAEKAKATLIGLRVKLIKHKANRMRKKTGIQQFVLMMNGRLTIMDKAYFTYNRQKGRFPKEFTATNLKQIAYYFTAK